MKKFGGQNAPNKYRGLVAFSLFVYMHSIICVYRVLLANTFCVNMLISSAILI